MHLYRGAHLPSRGKVFALFEKCRSWNHPGQIYDDSKFGITNGAEDMA